MEDKLNQLLSDADYYSAHQLILSLTKRKVKAGKTDEAIKFVKNGVTQLCAAKQFASAHDAAMSVFEYVKGGHDGYFEACLELLLLLLESPDAHYWRPFLNELTSKYPESRNELIDALLKCNISGNGDALAATCTLCVQVTSAARCEFLGRLAAILVSVADADASAKDANQFYLVEVAVALIKDGQFEDLNGYLKAVVNGLAGKNEDVEVVGAGQFSCVNDPQWRMVNFCVLLAQLCQRKAPKSLFTELCNEYCRDQDRLRQAVEAALVPVYWPAPKPRATGPPPDLMNMLSGLLGQAPRR